MEFKKDKEKLDGNLAKNTMVSGGMEWDMDLVQIHIPQVQSIKEIGMKTYKKEMVLVHTQMVKFIMVRGNRV